MTKSSLVSVLLTTYNRSAYLVEAVESIKNQTLSDWELIIVDDGSSDDSFEVARKYAESDERIQAVTQSNSGLATALNTGLSLAKGQYITRQDDDDLSHPNRLECMVYALSQNPELMAVVSAYDIIDAKGAFVSYEDWIPRTNNYRFFRLPFNANNPKRVINNSNTMYRKEALEKCKGWRPFFKYIEDYDLALRLESDYPVGVIDFSFYKYRQHTDPVAQMTGEPELLLYEYAALISHYCRLQGMEDLVDEGCGLYDILEHHALLPEQLVADVQVRGRTKLKKEYSRLVKRLMRQKKYTQAHDALQKMRVVSRLVYADNYRKKGRRLSNAFRIKKLASILRIRQTFFRQ